MILLSLYASLGTSARLCLGAPAKSITAEQEEINAMVKKSITLVESSRFNEALELLLPLVEKTEPPVPVLVAALANIYLANSDFSQAAKLAEKAHELDPSYDWPLILGTNSYLAQKNFPKAKELIIKLSKIGKPQHVYALQGDLLRLQGKYLKADKYYAKALSIDTENKSLQDLKNWNLETGLNILVDKGEYDEAMDILKKTAESDPDFDVWKIRGRIFHLRKRFDEADKQYLKSYKTYPNQEGKQRLYELRLATAREMLARDEIEEAAKWLKKAEEIKKDEQFYMSKADMFRQIGEHSDAEKYYLQASKAARQNPYIQESRAWNFTLAGNIAAAESTLRAAAEAAPSDPRFRVILALHYKRLGLLDESLEELAAARKLVNSEEKNISFNAIYPLDFFEYTPASGFALDAIGIPASLALDFDHRKKITNTESVIRGMGVQKIEPDQYDYYLPIKNTAFSRYTVRSNIYARSLPLLTLQYHTEKALAKDEEVDPTLNKELQQFLFEMPITFRGGRKVNFELVPMLRFTKYEGIGANNETIFGREYSNTENTAGFKFNIQPGLSSSVLAITAAQSQTKQEKENNSFLTGTYSGNLYTSFADFVTLNVGSVFFYSPDDPSGGKLLRQENRVATAVIFNRSSLGISYNDILYTDTFPNLVVVKTKFTKPAIELNLWPHPMLGLESKVTRFTNKDYTAYNHTTYETSLIFAPKWKGKRHIHRHNVDVPEALPLEIRVGYTQTIFPKDNVPDNDRLDGANKFSGVSYGLRLFW